MASIGFRWLDILEKEFDKAFVDLDLTVGELESEEPNVVFTVRQKLCTLSSCFAQLTHKAQTIFQNSAKLEAELVHMRAEVTESRSKRELLENELHHLLLQLHASQLAKLPDSLGGKRQENHFKPDISAIKQKFDNEIRQSPMRRADELKFSSSSIEPAKYKADVIQLRSENAALRKDVLALTSDVYGAKLAAKYLDKELAGRIQQLQLLGRELRGDVRDKLWRQLEAEILLQRHKTVVRACRRNASTDGGGTGARPEPEAVAESAGHFGDVRTVVVRREADQGLGISITGGREHGVPILISELEAGGPAALSGQLYIGDAILAVNEVDVRAACHRDAVDVLQRQQGDCRLQVRYVAADDSDNSLEEDGFHFKFFDEEVCDTNHPTNNIRNDEILNTPTAPRTPESLTGSRLSLTNTPRNTTKPTILDMQPPDSHCDNLASANNGNNVDTKLVDTLSNTSIHQSNNNKSPETTTTTNVATADLVLIDNATNNVIKLENFKKVDVFSTIDDNYNTSTNSLTSENLSSPMQTSTDVYVDSESPDSEGSSGSSPLHGPPARKPKKKHFGVKTLQSIFGKRDGYSDVSTTASEDELPPPHFDEHVHRLLSEMFGGGAAAPPRGQQLRVGKALRLCPKSADGGGAEQRREKLLARYVYNAANPANADGVGDPDFGTPV